MIVGVGTDLTELKRIEKACEKEAFFMRCFRVREREELGGFPCVSRTGIRRAAGDFAVKEAAAKALGTGFRGFSITDIEVLRDEQGAPYVTLYGAALQLAEQKGVTHWHVSISNTDELAIAFVVAERQSAMDTKLL